jgi:hypothetical protein
MLSGWHMLTAALFVSVGTYWVMDKQATDGAATPPQDVAYLIEARLNPGEPPDSPAIDSPDRASDESNDAQIAAVLAPVAARPDPAVEVALPPPSLPEALAASPAARVTPEPEFSPEPPTSAFLPPQPLLASLDSPPPAPRGEAIRQPARKLPERIELIFIVQSGEDGFVIGQSTYSGWVRDGRYALTSVAEATGVTGLFVAGKIVQRSEGRVTARGLQPEQFSGEKGKRIQKPVRFDWARQRLALPSGEVDLPAQAQDLLSFSFHLALVAEADHFDRILPVTNGKKLREYRFRLIGREMLNSGANRIDTVHLRGSREGDGSLDVWLAPDRHWLPVRIRTLDDKGKVILLRLKNAT